MAVPGHEGHQHVGAESELAALGGGAVGDDLARLDLLAFLNQILLVMSVNCDEFASMLHFHDVAVGPDPPAVQHSAGRRGQDLGAHLGGDVDAGMPAARAASEAGDHRALERPGDRDARLLEIGLRRQHQLGQHPQRPDPSPDAALGRRHHRPFPLGGGVRAAAGDAEALADPERVRVRQVIGVHHRGAVHAIAGRDEAHRFAVPHPMRAGRVAVARGGLAGAGDLGGHAASATGALAGGVRGRAGAGGGLGLSIGDEGGHERDGSQEDGHDQRAADPVSEPRGTNSHGSNSAYRMENEA